MFKKEALRIHKKLKGKISIESKQSLHSTKALNLLYTPGVAEPAKEIKKNKKKVYDYTMKGNTVAVISDGSAVLGLGNIGPEAALPIMEGKAALLKDYADIDAFPICLATQDTEEIIKTVKNIAPVFGGINLEDIEAPKCFEVEKRLQHIGIPVMHDDQHGTAVVVLAGLLNACKVTKKKFEDLHIVVCGAGAAGTAIAKLLVCADYNTNICKQIADVIVCDSKGILHKGRKNLPVHKKELVKITNYHNKQGTLIQALKGADVFIGVSRGNVLNKKMIQGMNDRPIIFALSNPTPEIMPDKAQAYGAAVVASGRSDFPNQINNILSFPGLFRGALDARVKKMTKAMYVHAAYAIAKMVKKPTKNKILPHAMNRKTVNCVSRAVQQVARKGD